MNSIEEKLWEYIDGSCTADEQQAISLLIEQDETYRKKYQELLSFNAEITAMELDEPSMAFTYKVMENIRAEHAKTPLKTSIDSRIIKVIGGFFVFTIAALLVYMFASINWSAGNGTVNLPSIKMPEVSSITGSGVFKGFMFFDVVLVLFLFDGFLRKRGVAKQS